jgi:hypothetical protein
MTISEILAIIEAAAKVEPDVVPFFEKLFAGGNTILQDVEGFLGITAKVTAAAASVSSGGQANTLNQIAAGAAAVEAEVEAVNPAPSPTTPE